MVILMTIATRGDDCADDGVACWDINAAGDIGDKYDVRCSPLFVENVARYA